MRILGKFLPKYLIKECINEYEKKDICLVIDKNYLDTKEKLLKKRFVKNEEFKQFIIDTRKCKYTDFYNINLKKKAKLESYSLFWDIKFNNCLFIAFNSFYKGIFNEFTKIIKSNKGIENLVIDLRNNYGGNLEECTKMCNILLYKCKIVNLVYKNKNKVYYADENKIKFSKIIILVNENTASCSEIFSLTLRKNLNNVYIVGNKTVGKNVGQSSYINAKYKYIFSISSFTWNVNGLTVENLFKYIKEDNQNYDKYIVDDDYYKSILDRI